MRLLGHHLCLAENGSVTFTHCCLLSSQHWTRACGSGLFKIDCQITMLGVKLALSTGAVRIIMCLLINWIVSLNVPNQSWHHIQTYFGYPNEWPIVLRIENGRKPIKNAVGPIWLKGLLKTLAAVCLQSHYKTGQMQPLKKHYLKQNNKRHILVRIGIIHLTLLHCYLLYANNN